MRWRSAPHACFPIARRQVKMTLAGTFPFRAGSARGRPTCAHGRRSRGKRRTRSWFVGAAGIAVRAIAPHVASKASDSAVVAIDEAGRFAVPLLSGHLGGANELAQTVARAAGAIPVITTATDVRGVWAVDTWARCAGLAVSNPEAIKRVSARLLSGGRVALYSDMPISGQPPEGVDIASDRARADIVVSPFAGANAGASVRAAETTGDVVPAGETGKPAGVRAQEPAPEPLRLVVPCIVAGIGCRRGACAEAIGEAFLLACGQAGISPSAVREAATIDVKAHEEGLLAFCRARNIPLATYSVEELSQVEGSVSPSDFVRATVGSTTCASARRSRTGQTYLPEARSRRRDRRVFQGNYRTFV